MMKKVHEKNDADHNQSSKDQKDASSQSEQDSRPSKPNSQLAEGCGDTTDKPEAKNDEESSRKNDADHNQSSKDQKDASSQSEQDYRPRESNSQLREGYVAGPIELENDQKSHETKHEISSDP